MHKKFTSEKSNKKFFNARAPINYKKDGATASRNGFILLQIRK